MAAAQKSQFLEVKNEQKTSLQFEFVFVVFLLLKPRSCIKLVA